MHPTKRNVKNDEKATVKCPMKNMLRTITKISRPVFRPQHKCKPREVLPSHPQLPKTDLIGLTVELVSRLATDMDLVKVLRQPSQWDDIQTHTSRPQQ